MTSMQMTVDEPGAGSLALGPGRPHYSAAEGMAQMHELQALVDSYLRPSTPGKADGDYGIIPGTDKPTLLKPGADKLCDIYGLQPSYEILTREVDWASGFISYEIRCRIALKGSGVVIGEGLGACNSRETRYMDSVWWNEPDEPPADSGWTMIRKKNGDRAWKRKVPNENPADLANTILKMAKKRAQVDAVLGATRSSGLFTQDLEDRAEPPTTATPAQLEKLTVAFASLHVPAEEQVRTLSAVLPGAIVETLLVELRRMYRAAATTVVTTVAAPPAAEPDATDVTIVDSTAVPAGDPTPVRLVVVPAAEAAGWENLAGAAEARAAATPTAKLDARIAALATQHAVAVDVVKRAVWAWAKEQFHVATWAELNDGQRARAVSEIERRGLNGHATPAAGGAR